MASIIKRLWSGSDFWDKEENKQQRQQYAAPRPQPEMEQKIKTARYGVLANNPQRQQQFIQDTKATPGPSILSTVHNAINDTLNANTQADQQRRLSQGLPRYYQDQSNLSKITRAAETGGRVTARVLQGIGQDTLGTYDLLTPGHGINRATKYYQNRGAQTDQEVKDMGLDENVYKAGQVPLALGSYMIPGKAVSNVGKIPRVARAGAAVERVVSKVPGATKAIGALDDLAANGDRFQRVTSRLVRSYTRPGNIADVGVDALQNAGHRTSLGQDNSLSTAGLDIGMSLGMQGGLNLAGQAVAPAIQTTTRLAKNTANNLMDSVAPVQTTTRLVKRTNRLNLDTTDALKAYSDMLVDADPYIQGKIRSDLIANVRDIGDQLGVDLTNGSVVDQMERIEAILNGYLPINETGRKLALTPLGEGGYAKNPFYRGDDITAGLSEQQAEFINDYANMLEGMGAGNGVDITPDGRRISNNFRDADTAGRTMTKQDWFEKARKDIESGKAGFGASDDYKKLPGVKSDPLESLKQEARKYKSAEEFVKAKTNQYHGTLDKEFKLDPNSRLFLTGDTDSASTYAGRRYNQEPEGKVVGYHAKDGKTLDLNDNATREEYVRDVLGQNKQLKKYYDQIPESARNDYFDTLGWVMEEHKAGRIPKADLDKYTEAQKNYKGISSKDVYANWDKIIARAKKDGYDYIKHTTEDPSAEITFPETVALNPSKTILDKQQLTDLYNQATQLPKSTPVQPDPLEALKAEARKYKSAEEFIVSKIGRTSIFDPKRAELRAIYDEASPKTPIVKNKRPERPAEPERWVAQKPIKMPNEVYRGVGKDGGTGMSMYGSGLYTAAGRKEAAKYGKVTKLGKENLPKNPLQFKTDLDFSQWQYEMAKKLGVDRKDLYGVDEGVEKLVKPLGYDGITIGQGKEMIAVKYGDDLYNQATQSQPPRPTATTKVENATKEQKVDFANYVLTNIRKHEQINSVGSVLTSLRNKDYPYHKEIMQMWKKWSRYNVGKPAAEAPVNKLPQQMTREEIAKTGVMRVGDADLPTYKTGEVIGDTTPLKKGNTRPDPLTTVSGRKIQLDQYNPQTKSSAADSRLNTKWNQTLIKAAIEEAKLRNDSMNLGIFEDMQGTSYKNLSESDMSGIHQYLFDSPDSIKLTYNQATQPPKSTPAQKQAPQPTKKPTPFEKDLQAAGLAPTKQTAPETVVPGRSKATSPKTSSAKAADQSQPASRQQQAQPSSRNTDTQPVARQTRQSEQSPANQPSKKNDVASQKAPVIGDNSTTSGMDSKEWGSLLKQADEELPRFDAVAGAKGTRNADRLADAINTDNKITRAAKEAQRTGKELHFFAKNDANGRSVGIEQFDPSTHRIEAGFVVDKNGNVVGNHIKVDNTGIQVNVGGDLINMGRVIGSADSWRGKYRVTETMSRNIDRIAPNKQVAQQTKDFVVGGKVKAEANYRVELESEFKKLGGRIKTTNKAKPRGVSKQQWHEDIFDSLDGKLSGADIRAKYGDKGQAILDYKKQTRELYDSLFERINAERVKFGQAPIEKRKDYITHLQELSNNRSFTGDVYASVRNSFTDEGMNRTRGGVPGEIAGRTENFQPRSAYNRFLQRRTGDKAVKDPFAAVQAYIEPALYNIHMTEATVRARAVESAFRTADRLKNMSADGANKQLGSLLEPYKGGTNGKLVAGFQEYANALAKKTQRWDRQIIDSSDASATALKGWQGLQRVGGLGTILGNVSSTMAQPLNQVITLADAGPVNYMKGVAAALSGDKAIQKSSFIRARATKAVAPIRSKGTKILDAGGVPLEKVEMASVKNTWHAMHAKAKAAGKQGMEAVKQADYDTERLVAGRGIADKPEIYRSTLSNGLLQYTLEVSAQNKAFWKDLSVSQKATFLVAAAGVNTMYGTITGFEPLPDFLGAALDTGKDFVNPEDDRTAGEKLVGGAQRMGSETVSMNPVWSAAANAFLTQNQRRTLFGKDSDLGRFEGTAAPIQVIKNSYRAGKSALDGNLADARNSALKTVPFGNQIRKTWTGAEANARGYAVDRNGKKTFETGKNVYEQAQNLLFGTSSTKSAQAYYSGDSKKKTELRQIGTTTTKDEKGNYTARDKYDTLIDAYKKNKDGTIGVNDYDTNELRNTIKQVGGDLNKELKAAGLREIKADSRHAVDYAKYKKSLAGKDELEVEKLRKDFYRDTYKSQLDKRTQAFYKLSDGKMRDAINSGKVTKEQLQKAIETDNYLTEKGLQSYLQIGKTLRRELGYAAPGGKGRGGRKGRGGKRKAIPKDLMAKAMDVPKVAQLRQSKITAKQPQARSFKTRRKAIPKIAKSTPKLTVKRTQTA